MTATHFTYNGEHHRQHVDFAKVWDSNLRSQGFAAAFEKQRQTRYA
jgi:hypothetical protein